jgi:hypothetical protein
MRSLHADARHHGRAIELDDQEQGFYRSLPFIEILLPWAASEYSSQGNELAAAGQGNGDRRTAGTS